MQSLIIQFILGSIVIALYLGFVFIKMHKMKKRIRDLEKENADLEDQLFVAIDGHHD